MKLDQVNWKLSLSIFRRRALTQPAHHPRWLCGRWEPRRSSPWCAGSLQRRWDHFKYLGGEDAGGCEQSIAIIDELSLDDGKPPEIGSNNFYQTSISDFRDLTSSQVRARVRRGADNHQSSPTKALSLFQVYFPFPIFFLSLSLSFCLPTATTKVICLFQVHFHTCPFLFFVNSHQSGVFQANFYSWLRL